MNQRQIREVSEGKGSICNDLLRSLPLWFGIEEAIQNYVKDVESMTMLVTFDGPRAVGFYALNFHNQFTAEIHVMAVHPEFHRHGLGRALQVHTEVFLKEKKFEYLAVKTLAPSKSCKEYALTRKFYEAMGFRPVQEFKTLWGEANPCLLMIKKL